MAAAAFAFEKHLSPVAKQKIRFAVIDLGTNSVRFDVYQWSNGQSLKRIFREKQMIRLGEELFQTGVLARPAIDRGLKVFGEFCKYLDRMNVDHITAFATSALREAKNSKEFIQQVQKKFGISIGIISGIEEAQLIAKGILSNEDLPRGSYALIDIGGGSTELSVCGSQKLLDSTSLPLGAARLKQLFFSRDSLDVSLRMQQIADLRAYVFKVAGAEMQKKKWKSVPILVGSSGTIRAAERMVKKSGRSVRPLKKGSLELLIRELSFLSQTELLAVPGMDPKRTDMILPGLILLDEVMNVFRAEKLFTSEFSLRDGILVETLSFLETKGPQRSLRSSRISGKAVLRSL